MLIYVRCITYGFRGKNDHFFTVKPTDTLLSLKKKIIDHFKSSEDIHMFDDQTEQLLESYDRPVKECFSDGPIYSLTFGEYDASSYENASYL